MSKDMREPIPWLGEGSVPPGSGAVPEANLPGPTRTRGGVGVVAGALALVLGMGVGGVAVSRVSLGEHSGSGVSTSQTQGGDNADEASGTTVQQPAAGGEEREED